MIATYEVFFLDQETDNRCKETIWLFFALINIHNEAKMTNLSSDPDKIGGVPTEKFGEVLDVEPKDPTSNVSGSNIRPLLELASDSGIGIPAASSASECCRLYVMCKYIENSRSWHRAFTMFIRFNSAAIV